VLTLAGLIAWGWWLSWRLRHPFGDVVGTAELAAELVAVVATSMLALAWWRRHEGLGGRPDGLRAAVDVVADALALDGSARRHGSDDTGEVACARRGVTLLSGRGGRRCRSSAERAAAVLAVEGIRRAAFVALLLVVLIGGRFPFPTPPTARLLALVAAQVALAVGLWLLSGGRLRPGERTVWSMRTVGAGLGDGRSRTGLPIRWATTMGTIIIVNLAVGLRGFSDRWTHSLVALTREERMLTMAVAWWLVGAGLVALRSLPQPALRLPAPSSRHEETSARRMALGGTVVVAVIGCLAGVLPGAVPA
jgi:hypothetical protein